MKPQEQEQAQDKEKEKDGAHIAGRRARFGRFLALVGLTALVFAVQGCGYLEKLFPAPDVKSFPVYVTPAIPQRPVIAKGEIFFTTEFRVRYVEGRVVLSSNPRGDGSVFVDDGLSVTVTHPDGTSSTRLFDLSNSCLGTGPVDPLDLTELFARGRNRVQIQLMDLCGGSVASSILWLVNLPASGGF